VALLKDWHRQVADADLSGYFDQIPHSDLLKSVARRVAIAMEKYSIRSRCGSEQRWKRQAIGAVSIEQPETNLGRGTPQRSPISLLFSNRPDLM
jgi:hypothetical protein